MSINKNTILNILFISVVFILTRQVPFVTFSIIGNIGLFGLILFGIKLSRDEKSYSIIYTCILILLWVLLLFIYSILYGNEVGLAMRFLIIIYFLILVHYVKLPKEFFKIFFLFVILQSILLIIFEFYLIIFSNPVDVSSIRAYFRANDWGTVYSSMNVFYKIQIKGNALIPFGLFLTYIPEFTYKRKRLFRLILIISLIIAGNFAYLIATFIFISIMYVFKDRKRKNVKIRVLIYSVSITLLSGFMLNFVSNTLETKDDSIGARDDQIEVLINDLDDNPFTLVFGKGLGNTIDSKTTYRDYTDMVYYELQLVYFLNQLGVFNFILFVFILIYLSLIKIKYSDLLFIYFCYFLYASTNPYILDTNQAVVILVLTNLSFYRNENRMHLSYL